MSGRTGAWHLAALIDTPSLWSGHPLDLMLHFRIAYQDEIKAFLVEYDTKWPVIAAKVAELFNIPAANVALVHKDSDGTMIYLTNHEELRSYILGPRSARAVAGLPLDFDLKDTREWKYSIISHIPPSEPEETEYEVPDRASPTFHLGSTKFTDDDYTFVQPPALDASDMVHVVVPGEGPYAVPRHTGVGSNVNIHVVEPKAEDEGAWDELKSPSDGKSDTVKSVDYPNVYLEEPPRPQSIASSGPPRIPTEKKGKGRAISSTPFVPARSPSQIEIASDKSIVNSEPPSKPTVHIPGPKITDSPIPLISNIVKKMSLEDAKARTIFDGEETPAPKSATADYNTLVTQLVSLVDVVSNLLEDKGVASHVRDAWEGFTHKDAVQPPSPTSTLGFGRRESYSRKSKEFALAEGLVGVMKKVATIVEDDASDIEERDDDVVWTHRPRGLADIRLPKVEPETKPNTPHVARQPTIPPPPLPPPPVSTKTSRQRLEEAKATYKAEKARYRAEREQRRRDKLIAKGLMPPGGTAETKDEGPEPVPVMPAPPGRRTSLMSQPADHPSQLRSRIAEVMAAGPKAPSSAKPTAGSTYSPALLPARISSNVPKTPTVPSVKEQDAAEDLATEGGDEGPSTPKPARPERASTQFDFDAFMEANAWDPREGSEPTEDKFPYPRSVRPSVATQPHASMLPPPRMYAQTDMATNPVPLDDASDRTAPTPPPRPSVFSPSQTPPFHVQNGMETMLADTFRANPVPRTSLKRNRWSDGMGGRRINIGRNVDSIVGELHPPPVYSTDGEGPDEIIESGGPVRMEKGTLTLNEEFKRRCLAVLHEYNVTQAAYPNLDILITQGIQVVGGNRQMVRLAAESNPQARETFLSEEVPNVVNRVLAAVQRGNTPNYV